MIFLRDFDQSDILDIDSVYRKQPWNGVPSLKNVIVNKTVFKDQTIVGYGAVKRFAVATMVLDPDIARKDKAETVRGMMRIAIDAAHVNGLEQLYLTTPFENFADVLRKQYGFVNCPNPFLVLEIK